MTPPEANVSVTRRRTGFERDDLVKLEEYADRLKHGLNMVPGLVDVDSTLSLRKPEVQVLIDRT